MWLPVGSFRSSRGPTQAACVSSHPDEQTVQGKKVEAEMPFIGLLDLANKNSGDPVKFEFQRSSPFLSVSMAPATFGI